MIHAHSLPMYISIFYSLHRGKCSLDQQVANVLLLTFVKKKKEKKKGWHLHEVSLYYGARCFLQFGDSPETGGSESANGSMSIDGGVPVLVDDDGCVRPFSLFHVLTHSGPSFYHLAVLLMLWLPRIQVRRRFYHLRDIIQRSGGLLHLKRNEKLFPKVPFLSSLNPSSGIRVNTRSAIGSQTKILVYQDQQSTSQ